MRSIWIGFAASWMVLAGFAGCSEDDGGGATPTGATTSTGSTTSSTGHTTTSSGGVCDVDLTGLLGASTACDQCANDNCCTAAEAYEADPTREAYNTLAICAANTLVAPCRNECLGPFCSDVQSYLTMSLMHDCAACVSTHCCDEFAACEDDADCKPCIPWNGFEADGCCGDALFAAWDGCVDTECAAECGQPVWYECHGTGGFGAGGAAGQGGGVLGGAGGSAGGGS